MYALDARQAWYPSTEAPDTGYFRYGVAFRLYRTRRLGPTRRRATLYACLFVLPVLAIARFEYDDDGTGQRSFVSTGPAVRSDWILSAWIAPFAFVAGLVVAAVAIVRNLYIRTL